MDRAVTVVEAGARRGRESLPGLRTRSQGFNFNIKETGLLACVRAFVHARVCVTKVPFRSVFFWSCGSDW